MPRDVNHDADIYEWRDGAVRLVTDGLADQPVLFTAPEVLELGKDGRDLLFAEVPPGGKLTGFEQDGLLNLYDARIGGGFEPPSPPIHCSEDSCQGPLQAAPGAGSPASAGFSGRGNVPSQAKKRRRCTQKRGEARRRCVRKHKEQAHRKASTQGNPGRAK